ncbi:MAG TPA: hypothetical protein VMW52_03780 [Phycisphaerae bacterium]|nr:hypothetical protein [Phycisphaerae bacterium]
MPDTRLWLGNDSGNEGDWDTAANFDPAGVPVTGDTVILQRSSQSVTAGLDQSAVTLAALRIEQSFTGLVGTLGDPLIIGATAVNLGEHFGPSAAPAGSQGINLDLRGASTITVANSAAASPSAESTLPPVRLLTDNASSVLRVRKGKVGLAINSPTAVSTIGTVSVGWSASQSTDADVQIGPGVTLTTLEQTGGSATLRCAATTVTQSAGALLTDGTGAITTHTITGGSAILNASGTITTLNLDGGRADLTRSRAARTITTLAARSGSTGQISYDPAVVTVTNKLAPAGPVTISLSAAA